MKQKSKQSIERTRSRYMSLKKAFEKEVEQDPFEPVYTTRLAMYEEALKVLDWLESDEDVEMDVWTEKEEKKEMNKEIKRMVEEKGEVWVAYKMHFQIPYKNKELRPADWEKIERDKSIDETIGVFETEEEAIEAVERLHKIRAFNNSGSRFLEWTTGVVSVATPDRVEYAEEWGEDLAEYIASEEEDGYIGFDELQEFCTQWSKW